MNIRDWARKIGRALGSLRKAADNVGDAVGEFEDKSKEIPHAPSQPPRPLDTPDDPLDRI